MMLMMMGDSYSLPIQLRTAEEIANLSTFEELEIMFGNVRKTISNGEITYDEERQMFLVPLSQNETFRQKNPVEVQARAKFFGGDVVGINLGFVDIQKSTSKVVL